MQEYIEFEIDLVWKDAFPLPEDSDIRAEMDYEEERYPVKYSDLVNLSTVVEFHSFLKKQKCAFRYVCIDSEDKYYPKSLSGDGMASREKIFKCWIVPDDRSMINLFSLMR